MSKKLIPIQIKLRVWNGTLDHSWYTNSVDGIAHISTPEQFADFITPTSSRSGITEVHLDNDLYFNENYLENKTWTVDTQNNSIVNTAVQSSRQLFTLTNDLTFYGHLHSIYGFSWKATSNSENHFIFLQGQTRNLTFKDLYWRNCYFTEAAGAGFIMGVEYNSTYGCHFQNVEFIDTYFDYRGANSWGVWNTSILTRTSRSSIVFNGCQFRNVTCIAQRGGQGGNFDDNYEYNIILKDCTSTTTNFNQIFYNGQTTKQLAYSYGNTSIVNNKTSYEELIDSFNSYESSTMELVDVEEDFTFENTPEPTDEHYEEPIVKPLSIPEGSDFLWRAKEYDASTNSIRNLVENSYFGTLNIMNTPTFVDGDKKYLNFTNVNQYLYHPLDSNAQQNILGNGGNNCYTIIFKLLIENTSPSTIIMNLTKTKTSYFNMLWKTPNARTLEIASGNNNTSKSNIDVINQLYIKYERTNNNITLTCLDTNLTQTLGLSGTQYIEDEIRFMSAGHTWSYCNRFYGVYGAPRKLTDEETQNVIKLLDEEQPILEPPPIRYQPRTEVEDVPFDIWDGTTDHSWVNDGIIDSCSKFLDFLDSWGSIGTYGLDKVTITKDLYLNNPKESDVGAGANAVLNKSMSSPPSTFDELNLEIDGGYHKIVGYNGYGSANMGWFVLSSTSKNQIFKLKNLTIDHCTFKTAGTCCVIQHDNRTYQNVTFENVMVSKCWFEGIQGQTGVIFAMNNNGGANNVNGVVLVKNYFVRCNANLLKRYSSNGNGVGDIIAMCYGDSSGTSGAYFPSHYYTPTTGTLKTYSYDLTNIPNVQNNCNSLEELITSYNENNNDFDDVALYNDKIIFEGHEPIDTSEYVYEDERVGQVTNILKDQTFPYTQQADYRDTYTWALYGRTVNSSTTGIEWTIAKPCTITFECWQSSEANYDYGHIDKNGSEIKSWRGQGATHSTYEASFVAGDKLRLRYTKDGSVSSGDDTFYCKMMIDGLGIDEHGDCFVGTTVRHWYKLGEKKLLLINKKDIGE